MKARLLIIFFLLAGNFAISQAQVVTTTANAGPGSLRQAIIDSNNDSEGKEIIFNIPVTDPGYQADRGVFKIQVETLLPPVTRNNLFINGTSQTFFTGNTNAVLLGGGVTVGVDKLPIEQVEGPEIEIVGNPTMDYGIAIFAKSVRIKGLAIYGFGNQLNSQNGNIIINESGTGSLIEGNYLGTFADHMSDPGEGYRTEGSNIAA